MVSQVSSRSTGPDIRSTSRLATPSRSHPAARRWAIATCHGANLGLLAARWLEVGGCGDGAVAEDQELWRRLRSVGAEVVGVDDLLVTTSGRLSGRAPLGFADYLARLATRPLEEIA